MRMRESFAVGGGRRASRQATIGKIPPNRPAGGADGPVVGWRWAAERTAGDTIARGSAASRGRKRCVGSGIACDSRPLVVGGARSTRGGRGAHYAIATLAARCVSEKGTGVAGRLPT